MIASGNQRERRISRDGVAFWACIVAIVVGLGLTISSSSLWIDEGYVAWVVAHTTWAGLWESTGTPYAPSPGDRQYPLYDAWLWCWTRIVTPDERGLRSANLPFAALYVVAVASTSKFAFKRSYAWIPFACAPFVVYFLSEARPYFMLLAFSTVSIGAACTFAFGDDRARAIAGRLILPSFVIAWATHILAVLALPGILAIAWYGLRKNRAAIDATKFEIVVWAIACVVVGCYYAATLGSGDAHRELLNNNRGAGAVRSLGEILYEQLGFAGLGPPKDVLRAKATVASYRAYVPTLGIGLVAYVAVLLSSVKNLKKDGEKLLLFAWTLPLAAVGAVTFLTNARFLGRHLAEVFPFFAFLAIATSRSRSISAILVAVFLLSDARMIVLPAYAKDDYRGAIAELRALGNGRMAHLDWAADDLTAAYYRLALNASRNRGSVAVRWPETQHAEIVSDFSSSAATETIERQRRTGPVYLAMSRADYFDMGRGIRSTIDKLSGERVFTTSSFEIFRFGKSPTRDVSLHPRHATSDSR